MFIKNCLLSIILLLFLCFSQSQCMNSSTNDDIMVVTSINGHTTTLESNASDSSIVSNSFTSVYSTTPLVLTAINEMENSSVIFESTKFSSVVDSPSTGLSTSQTSISSTRATTTVTSTSIVTNINVTYKYSIISDVPLQIGIINNTDAVKNVQSLVNNSFNLSDFDITVIQSQIQYSAKNNVNYDLLIDILFGIRRIGCNISCIESAKLVPMMNISLPNTADALVTVYILPGPPSVSIIITTTTTTENYPTGGPSPGLPAQLGMGIGISLIGILLIVEIIFLYWKYGLSKPSRGEDYVMPCYG